MPLTACQNLHINQNKEIYGLCDHPVKPPLNKNGVYSDYDAGVFIVKQAKAIDYCRAYLGVK